MTIQKNHSIQDLFSYFSAMNTIDEGIDYQWISFEARTKTNLVVVNKELDIPTEKEIVHSKGSASLTSTDYALELVSSDINSYWNVQDRNECKKYRSSSLVLHPLKSSKSSLSFSSFNPFASVSKFDPCKEAVKNFKRELSMRSSFILGRSKDTKHHPVIATKVRQELIVPQQKVGLSRYLNRQKPTSAPA
jgi:hypothetical protein